MQVVIRRTHPEQCLFPVDICHRGMEPFEIIQYNISAYDIGVNSRSRLVMNHRLTSAPVPLSPLYRSRNFGPSSYGAELDDLERSSTGRKANVSTRIGDDDYDDDDDEEVHNLI